MSRRPVVEYETIRSRFSLQKDERHLSVATLATEVYEGRGSRKE